MEELNPWLQLKKIVLMYQTLMYQRSCRISQTGGKKKKSTYINQIITIKTCVCTFIIYGFTEQLGHLRF